jgi:ubiquinone/menaquinone biosynthesis C-methylase UbiE
MNTDYYHNPKFAEAYDADMGVAADAMDDVPFYLELAQQAANEGHAVLELGCGTGRVTLPIARRGIEIVGLDNAPPMLAIARRKATKESLDLTWVEADMNGFQLNCSFGLIIIPYRSFLHLLTDADQASCLAAIRSHLVPGGRLALNFFAPPFALQPGDKPVISKVHKQMRLRYVSKEEMTLLLDNAEFEVEALYGGFGGESFTASSDEMVWLAKKRVS